MQHEITTPGLLLNKYGIVREPGFARTELLTYNREAIAAPWYRRKEWDYYLFMNDTFALAFTISDLGYIGLLSVSFLDLLNAKDHTASELVFFPRGKRFGLGGSVTEGNVEAHTKKLDLVYAKNGDIRTIDCSFREFEPGTDFTCHLMIDDPPMESMYIATPWAEKPTAFYYNCKRNLLSAYGTATLGGVTYDVKKGENYGCLDWGRGVWTYDNIWYWGTGSGLVDGKPFGFNLGYGFSDRSYAAENCLYTGDGKIHKLDEVTFLIPMNEVGEYQYTEPWIIDSSDDRFKADFKPILDRTAKITVGPVQSDQHQVFGRLTGSAVLDSGETVSFTDFMCAVEVIHNKY